MLRRIRAMIRSWASTLEDLAAKEAGQTLRGRVLNILLYKSLADRFSPPLKTVVYSPVMVLLALVVVYLLFCLVWLPLYLISLLVTWWGSVLILVSSIVAGARSFARTVMFPGSTRSLQKQYSVDFLRRLTYQVDGAATLISRLSLSLINVSNGRASRPATDLAQRQFREVYAMFDDEHFLGDVETWLRESLAEARALQLLTPDELVVPETLLRRVEEMSPALHELRPAAADLLSHGPSTSIFGSSNSKSALLRDLCKIVQTKTEALQTALINMKPRSGGGDAEEPTSPGGGGGLSGGLFSGLKAIVTGTDGPAGIEKLAFPIMRQQLKTYFGGERTTVLGIDDNAIDVMYVPSAQAHEAALAKAAKEGAAGASRPFQQSGGAVAPLPVSPMGTVLFCAPNAGLFECVSQASKEASWVGFYTSLGFDVCFFNYRGYGSSVGVPDPERVKQDGLRVARFLRLERRVAKLIIHGESIGGMCAAHVAAHCPPELLICDRSFASLDAVAQRLMGSWAALGLRYVGLYRTDVVTDFLRAPCKKVLLQDPSDEIIHNSASLKNGVATFALLGDGVWAEHSLAADYAAATIENLPLNLVPERARRSSPAALLLAAKRTEGPGWLTEELVEHFFACLQDVARRSALAVRARSRRAGPTTAGGGLLGRMRGLAGIGSPARSAAAAGIVASSASSSSASAAAAAAAAASNSSATSTHAGALGPGSAASAAAATAAAARSRSEDDGDDLETSSQVGLQGLGGVVALALPPHSAAMREPPPGVPAVKDWVDAFCSQNVASPSAKPFSFSSSYSSSSSPSSGDVLTPVERAWIALARTNGGSGQLLGQALAGDLDGVRCWLCSVVVWSSRAASDPLMPQGAGRADALKCSEDLRLLTNDLYPDSLGRDDAVLFARDVMALISQRSGLRSFALATAPRSFIDEISSTCSHKSGSFLEFLSSWRRRPYSSISEGADDALDGASSSASASASASSASASGGAGVGVGVGVGGGSPLGKVLTADQIGRVISVHCGHNGWPQSGLPALVECLREAGFACPVLQEWEGGATLNKGASNFPPIPHK